MAEQSLDGALRQIRKLAAVQTSRELEDRHLLERFVQAKDEASFTVLVERHGPMVLGVCRRALHNAHDAEDACQATFLVLARQAASVRKVTSLYSWLHGVACRVASNLKREQSRRHRRERQVHRSSPPDPPAEASWREVQAALDEELQRLPERLRVPLILCYLEGQTRDAAAHRLGLTIGSLHGLLQRGRQLLHDRLTKRGFTLSTALFATALGEGVVRASLSPTLVLSSARVATLVVAGQPVAPGVISSQVLTLTHGVLKTMFLAKLKRGLLAVMCAGVLLTTIGGLLASVRPEQESKSPPLRDSQPGPAAIAATHDADKQPLPAGAIHRLGSRRFRVAGRNDFALPTPDGKYVLVHPQPALSAYAAQGLVLFDVETGLPVRMFEDSRRVPKSGELAAIRPAAFSPDGKTLYALGWHSSEKDGDGFAQWARFDNPSKRVLLVWDVTTGKRKAEWEMPSSEWRGSSLLGVNVSPDGKRLYVYGAIRMRVGPDGRIQGVPGIHVLDAATGKMLQTWDDAGHPVGMTAGKELITFRRGAAITAHDVTTGQPVRRFALAGYIPSVALSADGKTIAALGIAGESGKQTCVIKLWDSASGRELRRLTVGGQVGYGARLVFAADGKSLYLGTGAGRILRWDLATGRIVSDWSAHNGLIADLCFRPGTNELISAGRRDGAVRRWDAKGKSLSVTDAYIGEIAVARTPDGKRIATIDGVGRLDVWDVTTGRVIKTLPTPGRKKHILHFTPDGKHLLIAAEAGPNTVWDLSAGKQVGEFAPPPKKDPKADEYWWGMLRFSPDGRRLLASKFGRGTWMWTWPEKKILWHEAKEQESCFFRDEKTVVSGDWHYAIEFRDVRTGAVKRTVPEGLSSVSYSPDRTLMVTAQDEAWRVRDGETGAVLKEGKGFQYAWSVAFSPSGWLLAVAGDNSVRVYDSATWQEVARLDGHEGTVRTVFFGPTDATLISASAEDGTALVWSLKPPALRKPPDPAKLWDDLAGNGPPMTRAVWAAADHPDIAIRLFREKWPIPKRPVDPKHVRKIIADLDSSQLASRDAATAELEKLGRQVEAALRKELTTTESAEVKRRVRKILSHLAPPVGGEHVPEDARELRAVWALELAGTKEARKLLADWAEAKVGNRLCVEAASAIKRWQGKE